MSGLKRDLAPVALMVAGLALTYVPGDHYLALRFVGWCVYYGCAGFCAWVLTRDAWRWVRAHTFAQTAGAVGSFVPTALVGWYWVAGPGWWPLRVALGVVALLVVTFVATVGRVLLAEHRRSAP